MKYLLCLSFFLSLYCCPGQICAKPTSSSTQFEFPTWGGGISLGAGFSIHGATEFGFDIAPVVNTVIGEVRFLFVKHHMLDLRFNLTAYPYWNFSFGLYNSYYWRFRSSRFILGLGVEPGFSSFFFLRIPLRIGYELLLKTPKSCLGIQFAIRPFVSVLPVSHNPFLYGGGTTFEVSIFFYKQSRIKVVMPRLP